MSFGPDAGPMHKRARTNLGLAGQGLDEPSGNEVGYVAVELALAEAGTDEESATDQICILIMISVGLPWSHTIDNNPALAHRRYRSNLLDDKYRQQF